MKVTIKRMDDLNVAIAGAVLVVRFIFAARAFQRQASKIFDRSMRENRSRSILLILAR